MLTELEFLELYMYNLKIKVLNLELLIYVCKVNKVASKDFELLCSQKKGELVFYLFIYKISIVAQ